MIALVVGSLAQFLNDERLRHVCRVAHAEVDDIDAVAALAVFQVIDLAE